MLGLRCEDGRPSDGFTATATQRRWPTRSRSESRRLAEGGAVVAVDRTTRCSRPRSAAPCACRPWRALRRDHRRPLVVHQRPEPQAREVVDRRAERREGPGQRRRARHAVPRDHATTRYSQTSSIPNATHQRACRTSARIAHQRLRAGLHRQDVVHARARPGRQRDLCRLDDHGERRFVVPATASASGSRACRSGAPPCCATLSPTRTGPSPRRRATAARNTRTLDNSDVNGFTYLGVSKFFMVDVRARYQFDKQWSAAFGIDNAQQLPVLEFPSLPAAHLHG